MSSEEPRKAIRVTGLSKRYRLGGRQPYKRVGESVASLARRVLRLQAGAKRREMIWALKDVSFDVNEGEILGFVGANGSGKTTLLRILSKITLPTEGRAEIDGRVGSLLEVGTGFHPELTGRENVFLNGAILGMTKKEILSKYDQILGFADIDQFMDTPVKHYSSGMRVRLAFSVAAHLEPEILLIDEVLAVGDVAFQQKCLGKMEEVAGSGRTVLFVSHNLGVVTSLCSRAIWLHEGKLLMDADPQEVVEAYLSSAGEQAIEGRWENTASVEPGAKARVTAVEVVDPGGVPRGTVPFEDPILVRVESEVFEAIDRGAVAVRMTDMAGTLILATSSAHGAEAPVRWPPGRYRYSCTLPGGLFRSGRYFLTVAARTFREPLDRHEHCLEFEIAPARSAQAGRKKKQGIVTPAVPWMQERIDESP